MQQIGLLMSPKILSDILGNVLLYENVIEVFRGLQRLDNVGSRAEKFFQFCFSIEQHST